MSRDDFFALVGRAAAFHRISGELRRLVHGQVPHAEELSPDELSEFAERLDAGAERLLERARSLEPPAPLRREPERRG